MFGDRYNGAIPPVADTPYPPGANPTTPKELAPFVHSPTMPVPLVPVVVTCRASPVVVAWSPVAWSQKLDPPIWSAPPSWTPVVPPVPPAGSAASVDPATAMPAPAAAAPPRSLNRRRRVTP